MRSRLAALSMFTLLCLCLSTVHASRLPGRGKLKVNRPPAAGMKGEMTFYFKPLTDLARVNVSFGLPNGLDSAGEPMRKELGPLKAGRIVRVPCAFVAREMGIFRVSAMVSCIENGIPTRAHTWYSFFEAGADRGYFPTVKPANLWQEQAKSVEPAREDYVQIRKGVYRSPLRITTDNGTVYRVDPYPPLPCVGDIDARMSLSAPPLLNKPVKLTYEAGINERGRRRGKVELLLLLPPNGFRVIEVTPPPGGSYKIIDRGIQWRGPCPRNGVVRLTATIASKVPGEGKIRALMTAVTGRRRLSNETPLFLEVNQYSARVLKTPAFRG